MPSSAFAGVGTALKRGDSLSSATTFTSIAEVRNISGPSMSRETIDVTSLDSTGGYREYITGFRDGGEVTFTMNFTLGGYSALLTDFQANTTRAYQIVLSDTATSTFQFDGLITGIPLNISPDDAVTVDVTIKVTGAVSLTT